MSHQFSIKVLLSCVAISVSSLSLGSCELSQNYLKQDRANNMEPQDYRDALAPRQVELDQDRKNARQGVPPLKDYVVQPNGNYKAMPLVSISVNQTVPLRDVIYEIAEQAEYDVELDPRIKGSIIFSARNRPLDVVIDRIAAIGGLRYEFRDDMLRVEVDTPYHEIYKVNYLALTRTNSSSISNDISVVSGEGADTGSNFSAVNESVLDFWGELETNLTQIVEANRNASRLATTTTPQTTIASANPTAVEPLSIDENGNIVPSSAAQDIPAILTTDQLSVDGDEETVDTDGEGFLASFSINKQAGLISVFAPERLHRKIDAYMTELKKSVSSQVLIEAKVLEVELRDEFSAGIDWQAIDLFGGEGSFGFSSQVLDDAGNPTGLVRGLLAPQTVPFSNALATFTGNDFTAAVNAVSRFGNVQALSSPRLTVLNNQSAALNVAENRVFFEITTETTIEEGVAFTENTAEVRTVPEGVLINVQPSIDLDTGQISMAIRPTITTITRDVPDPINAGNFVPQVNVQEFDSIIQMGSGQAVVMGGLMQDRVQSARQGTPVLAEVPMLGALFRNQNDNINKTELVVFLKATIVENGNTIHNTDKDLYRQFSGDRRPLKF